MQHSDPMEHEEFVQNRQSEMQENQQKGGPHNLCEQTREYTHPRKQNVYPTTTSSACDKLSLAGLYFRRAMRLCCPTCGKSPIFIPSLKTRSFKSWFTPLDGCPRCGYHYEREPGYFLLATWAGSYGAGSLLGLALYFFLDWKFDLPIWDLLILVILPVIVFNLLFARHTKALFLAFDHFFDPLPVHKNRQVKSER